MANLLRSKADLAQKKRMITTRRVAFATTDKKLYPARSKRNHTVVAPASARTAAFLLLHRSTSATGRSKQIEQSTTINIEKKQHSQGCGSAREDKSQTWAAAEGTVHGSRDLGGKRR